MKNVSRNLANCFFDRQKTDRQIDRQKERTNELIDAASEEESDSQTWFLIHQ